MSHSPITHTSPSVNPYSGPGITIETKLMNQYRLASPVDSESDGVAVRNADGQIELFTVGTDGTVWNISPDPISDTGYRALNTGLNARKVFLGGRFAAGLDHDGSIVAFARGPSSGNLVSYATKRAGVWSSAAKATLPSEYTGPGESDVGVIFDIRARTIDGQLFVALVGRIMSGGPTYLAVSNWSSTPGIFKTFTQANSAKTPVSQWPSELPVGTGFWTRTQSSRTPAFSIFVPKVFANRFQGFITLDVDCNFTEYVSSSGGLPNFTSATVDIESPTDSVGRNKMFGIASGRLYQFTDGKVRNDPLRCISYDWPTISGPPPRLRKVHAVHDHKGSTHLFCISEENGLYHLPPDPKSPTGYQPVGLPIKRDVLWIAVARNDAGNIELFCAKSGAGAPLIHLTLDQDTGDWEEQLIEVQSLVEADNKLEEFISYSTDISFTDSQGAPLANAAVKIRASDRTAVYVNSATYAVDATHYASVTADCLGKLTISHQTSGLSVPDLWIHVAPLMPEDKVLVLQQYANGRDDKDLPDNMKSIQARLTKLSGAELASAKDAKGNYLLDQTYRTNEKFTKDLATACNQCMKLGGTNTVAAALHPLISRRGTWTGLHIESPSAALARNRIVPHASLPSWSLSLEKGAIHYQTLTPEQARATIAEMRANAGTYAGADGKSWWSTIGDFFESILEGIVTISKVVIEGVNAAFHFVVGAVTYIFEAVVKVVQDSFDMLESILATVYDSVAGFFERTFEWIGFLLNWDDILRTQEALCHVVDEMLKFLKMAGPAMQKRVDAGFAGVQTKIGSTFDELIARADGKTFGSFVKDNDRHDPVAAHALGNNVVGNAYMSNWQDAKVPSAPVTASAGESNDLWRLLEQFGADKAKKPEWQSTSAYLERVSSPDQFFSDALKSFYELLKNLALAVVSGAQDIIDKLLQQLTGMIDALRDMLTKEVPIPLVSELFKSKVGRPLNAMNLMALIAAVPTTVLYKAIKGAAPFPDETSVNTFKAAFTARWMFNAAGLGPEHEKSLPVAVSAHDRFWLQIACGVMTICYGGGTAYLNYQSAQNTILRISRLGKPFRFFSCVAFVFELTIQGCSFPLCVKENPSTGSYVLWGYQNIGVIFDSFFVVTDGSLPQNVVDSVYPVLLAGFFGVFDLVGNVWKGVEDVGDAPGILISLAECCNWMLFKPILRSPYGEGIAVSVTVLTGVFYGAAGILQIVAVSLGETSDLATAITLDAVNA